MKRLTTESGATYLWDELNRRFKREIGPEVVDRKADDGVWVDAHAPWPPLEGYAMVWYFGEDMGDVKVRRTTLVVSVEEVTPPLLED